MRLFRSKKTRNRDIAPDEIFLDDRNIPEFDVHRFEGRIETPIRRRSLVTLGCTFLLVGLVFLGRAGILQIKEGSAYAEKSEQNRLEHQFIFPERGVITDRNGIELAWNTPSSEELGFSLRSYIKKSGFGHILGYLHYPARDSSGVYYRTDYEAAVGVEAYYNDILKGEKGLRVIEMDALGNVTSANTVDPPLPGKNLKLAIDARVQVKLHEIIEKVALDQDYRGGAGAIMDIKSGDMLAVVSYPEFNPDVITAGDDRKKIASYQNDVRSPFLNRAVSGLYTPGSIVKPVFALAALYEGLFTPDTHIYSAGYFEIPNPFFPEKPTRFNDWRAHGMLDMAGAIAQSSNVYFYQVAGGFKDQKGLGIRNLEKYARLFGYGKTTGIDLQNEAQGTIPNPEWKAEHFPDDPTWRIGDTYFTGIGQYGMQATLLQALREAAIIASKGIVVTPHVAKDVLTSSQNIGIPEFHYSVIHEGMREAVTVGTAKALDIPQVAIAAKSGTAELGTAKARVNSWVIGFFPYEEPKYAFAIMLDSGLRGNATNASYVGAQLFYWMGINTPEYVEKSSEQ